MNKTPLTPLEKHYLETYKHIQMVQRNLTSFIKELQDRLVYHDWSKMIEPEASIFAKINFNDTLKNCTYGSDEYKENLKQLKVALDNHYKMNDHHPEHHEKGIDDMTLMEIVEMYCDWKAASLRHQDGNMNNSIEHNKDRFAMSDQLVKIFKNTYEAEQAIIETYYE